MNKDWQEFVANLRLPKDISAADLLDRMKNAKEAGKNPYASALGIVGGRKGGKASAESMNEGKRQDRAFVASMAAKLQRGEYPDPDQLRRLKGCKRDHGWVLEWFRE